MWKHVQNIHGMPQPVSVQPAQYTDVLLDIMAIQQLHLLGVQNVHYGAGYIIILD